MDLLRRHLFFMICGLAGATGIALGVTGINAMSKVAEGMKTPEGLYRNLNSLRSQAVNMAMLDAERQRAKVVVDDRNAVFENATALVQYEPLVKDVFPDGTPLSRIEFRSTYAEAMEKLLVSLHYGGPATNRDIDAMQERIGEEEAEAFELGREPGESRTSPAPSVEPMTPAGVLTKVGARSDPVARSHIAAAQRIFCYAVHFADERLPGRPASLDFEPGMVDTGSAEPPTLEDVWRAQIGYWIQKDVVDAITALNNEAAEEVGKQEINPWVGIMPIKEVISVRVSPDYVMSDSEGGAPANPGGYAAAFPPGGPGEVFTERASGPQYEVVQFTVKLIMDQRNLPQLLSRLSKDSFYTLLGLSYEAVPVNRRMVGKVYGEEPAVNVVIDFETIMLGEVFRELMPQEVCDYYEINCPEREEGDEGD